MTATQSIDQSPPPEPEYQPQYGDFFRFPELIPAALRGIPFPLALAREKPLRGSRSVVDIAAAYHQIARGAPPDDLVLAALYAYLDLRPEQRELALLLSLLSRRA